MFCDFLAAKVRSYGETEVDNTPKLWGKYVSIGGKLEQNSDTRLKNSRFNRRNLSNLNTLTILTVDVSLRSLQCGTHLATYPL